MNSRFKFRVWDKSENEFITHVYRGFDRPDIYLTLDGKIKWTTEFGEGECENLIIQQWTGHKDINGVDIYEGDIIKTCQTFQLKEAFGIFDYTHGEIKWMNEGFQIIQKNIGKTPMEAIVFCDCCSLNVEVIGNIFKNKEYHNDF